MQIIESLITTTFDMDTSYFSANPTEKDKILFFDIETTGFSAAMSYVYLIGCVSCEKQQYTLHQWFMEDIREEKELLTSFFEFMKSYQLLVHYNGSGFDIPYLLQKCSYYNLGYDFQDILSFDIYKQLIPYKKRIPLPNLKLKTVENFLSISRKDQYSGGELIGVYTKYLALHVYERKHSHGTSHYQVTKESGLPTIEKEDPNLLKELLLLHNAEDIKNLPLILPILSFVSYFEGNLEVTTWEADEQEVRFYFELKKPLPMVLKEESSYEVLGSTHPMTLTVNQTSGCLRIALYYGCLKFYFDQYKDYYYLPLEDTAVHKSVGEFVEKEYRQAAKPDTCYQKKTGFYLPQSYPLITPSFRTERKQKQQFFEVNQEILDQECTCIVRDYVLNYFK